MQGVSTIPNTHSMEIYSLIRLFFLLILTPATIVAQIDTTSALYDFESLPNGNLNGVNGWKTTLYNTSVDWRIADTLNGNVGKGIFFNQVGPNVGASASRAFDSIFPAAYFDRTVSEYVFQFDVVRNYWGIDIGFAADLNNDGKTGKTDQVEKALIFRTGSLNGESLTVPNGTTYTFGNNLTNAWYSIRITIRPYTGNFGGTVDVEYQPVFAPTWTLLGSGLPLYADSISTTKTNITHWDMTYIHSEGAVGKADELRFTRIGPQQTTGISEISEGEINICHSNGNLIIESSAKQNPSAIEVFDTTGRCVFKTSCGSCSILPVGSAASGKHFVRVSYPDGRVVTRSVFIP